MQSSGAILNGLAAVQTATGTSITGATKLHGIRCTASVAGVLTVYDNTSAAGKQVYTSLAMTANTYYPVAAGDAVLQMLNGVHCVLVSGTATWDVYTAP